MADALVNSPFPDYEDPPIVETILGVQFERLPKFKNAHLGAFWKSLDTRTWPVVSDAPTLEPQFERFGDPAKWGKGLRIQLTQDSASRLQIKNLTGDRMLQIQNGRLHLNWLRTSEGEYPRYTIVRQQFEEVFHQFKDFIETEDLGEIKPNQWEVTYLNHVVKHTLWNTPSDWKFFKPLGEFPSIVNLIQAESFHGEWQFIIPDRRGRLHVEWRHALKPGSEEQELVVLTFTARGSIPEESDTSAILAGLNLGHEVIVRSFASFMTKDANDKWGLKNANN